MRHRARGRLAGLLAAVVLAACQVAPVTVRPGVTAVAGGPAPSATPAPPTGTPVVPASATPVPPSPTVTATATATGTPTAAGTPDPDQGVGQVLSDERFDGAGWRWAFQDEAVSLSLAGGHLNAVMTRADLGWRVAAGPEVTAGDQQVRLVARVNLCYERDEYGLFLRGQAPSPLEISGYVFKLNCAGQARVEVLRANQPSVLIDWTPAAAIQAGAPAENVLLVWAAGDQFHFFVNDRHLGSAVDRTFATGRFGLFLRDRTNGGLSLAFTALTVRAVAAP